MLFAALASTKRPGKNHFETAMTNEFKTKILVAVRKKKSIMLKKVRDLSINNENGHLSATQCGLQHLRAPKGTDKLSFAHCYVQHINN